MNEKLFNEMNNQINKELYSGYLYLAMANYFESISFKGFAKYFKKQAVEEFEHAEKFSDFLNNKGHKVTLFAIEQPENNFKDTKHVFEFALNHEIAVTKSINDLVELAINEKDYSTISFLKWFVDEQVEEEEKFREILEQLKFMDCSCSFIYGLNMHFLNA